MLPSYPPAPTGVTGFDTMLSYAVAVDPDPERAEKIVRLLRRESLRRGGRLSAAKSLYTLLSFLPARLRLRAARRLVVESPEAAAYFMLASAERDAGHVLEARVAAKGMLRVAERAGDLDKVAIARQILSGASGGLPDSFGHRLGRAANTKAQGVAASYASVRRLKADALRRHGRATAFECVRALLVIASSAEDVSGGLRFARELFAMSVTSFSTLALALAHERCGDSGGARQRFAQALRLSKAEGDLHRGTKATAGVVRTDGAGLVTEAEMGWVMGEARKEADGVPEYSRLRATLGWVGVRRKGGGRSRTRPKANGSALDFQVRIVSSKCVADAGARRLRSRRALALAPPRWRRRPSLLAYAILWDAHVSAAYVRLVETCGEAARSTGPRGS